MENQEMYPVTQAEGALAQVEQSRAVAEVQASIVLARANPRNEERALMKIMNACKRKSLAEQSSYSFKRGTSLISGPNIRLLEVIARYWQNLSFGFREIGRGSDYSEVESFAHDLETNTRVTRQFQVKHWRDTKSGGYAIKEERDKYELIANMAQRRVRACLIGVIPADVVEAAEEACKATLLKDIGDLNEATEKIVKAFSKWDITREMIEAHLQRKLKSIVGADIVNLRRIYNSIKDGVAGPEEFFNKETTSGLEQKILNGTEDKFVCDLCPFVAKSERGLKKHMTQSHADSPAKETDEPITLMTDEQRQQLLDIFAQTGDASGNEFMQWYRGGWDKFSSIDAEKLILGFDEDFQQFTEEMGG